jgi:hypothetical protein
MESKYHQVKNKLYLKNEEEKEYRKSSIAKMIENFYINQEELPKEVLKSINFLEVFTLDYYMYIEKYQHNIHINESQTIAENLINTLPLKMYEKYMDTSWLWNHKASTDNRLIANLIFREKWDILEKFLSIIEQETKENDFNQSFFEPIFAINDNLRDYYDSSEKENINKVKNYFDIFQKTLFVFKDFYKYKCEEYKANYRDVTKWHRNFEYIYEINKNQTIEDINEILLKNDEFLYIIKDICSQYENPKKNSLLTKENFKKVIENGCENIFMFYKDEFIKHNILTQDELEKLLIDTFHETLIKAKKVNDEYFDKRENAKLIHETLAIDKIYNLVIKNTQYEPKYEYLSYLIFINNPKIDKIIKTLPQNKIKIFGLNIEEIINIKTVFEDFLKYTGKYDSFYKDYENSIKKSKLSKEIQKELLKHPQQLIYLSERAAKLFSENKTILKDKSMDKILNIIGEKLLYNLPIVLFSEGDYEKIKIQYKLDKSLEEKTNKTKMKI